MPEPEATLELHHATIELHPDRVITRFRDGKEVPACPNGEDTLLDTAIHEGLHSMISEATEDCPSFCLRAQATGDGNRWTPERRAEEALAYSIGLRMAQLVRAMKQAGYV